MNDPRKAKTLGEAALNPDGVTYNGARTLSWLSEVLAPGRGFTEAEVQRMWQEALDRRSRRG